MKQANIEKILDEEKEILAEVRKEEKLLQRLTRNTKMLIILVVLFIVGGTAGIIYWKIVQGRVHIENAEISAPHIELAPNKSGVFRVY
jgi:multidrug resistance efflux pump